MRFAHPHDFDASGVGGGDLEQAVDAGADHEQRVAGAQPGAVLGAEHARERLDERGGDRVEVVGELEQLRDQLRR